MSDAFQFRCPGEGRDPFCDTQRNVEAEAKWIPAFAGMTKEGGATKEDVRAGVSECEPRKLPYGARRSCFDTSARTRFGALIGPRTDAAEPAR